MDGITYKLEKFEGPLDLLLNLIKKNKFRIEDIPISLICDQYLEYISMAQRLDIELAVEFLSMASELMLIKSKMLLPREVPEEEDPRARLAEAIARLEAAKQAAVKLGERYAKFQGRMEKDTDEISVDRTFVADQDPERLYDAMRRVLSYASTHKEARGELVRPIAKPIIPVELKIIGIMEHFREQDSTCDLGTLLDDAVSRPDLVAIFIGVLELIKLGRLVIIEGADELETLHGVGTRFAIGVSTSDGDGDDDSIAAAVSEMNK